MTCLGCFPVTRSLPYHSMGLYQPSHFHPHTPTPPAHLPPQTSPILQHLLHSSEQQAQDGSFDMLMSMDGRSKGPRQHLKHILQVTKSNFVSPFYSYILTLTKPPLPCILLPFLPRLPYLSLTNLLPISLPLPLPPSYSSPFPFLPTLLPLSLPPSTLPLTKSLLRPNLLIFFTS